MTLTLSVTDRAVDLAKLLERARKGEEVIVLEDGKPVARFILLDQAVGTARVPGTAKGQIWISEDFDAPLSKEMQEAFES